MMRFAISLTGFDRAVGDSKGRANIVERVRYGSRRVGLERGFVVLKALVLDHSTPSPVAQAGSVSATDAEMQRS